MSVDQKAGNLSGSIANNRQNRFKHALSQRCNQRSRRGGNMKRQMKFVAAVLLSTAWMVTAAFAHGGGHGGGGHGGGGHGGGGGFHGGGGGFHGGGGMHGGGAAFHGGGFRGGGAAFHGGG